ncbi:MAG: hypothetical protein K8R58_08220 [Bacteroidales bacterium]|nr:hypothetical protein [Bacteroidales bacterium]
MSNNHDTIARDIFQERIKKGLLGPGSDIFIDDKDISEEIIADYPLQRYYTGVLFPERKRVKTRDEQADNELNSETGNGDSEDNISQNENIEDVKFERENDNHKKKEVNEDDELKISQNTFFPSNIGLTFCIDNQVKELDVEFRFGLYSQIITDIKIKISKRDFDEFMNHPSFPFKEIISYENGYMILKRKLKGKSRQPRTEEFARFDNFKKLNEFKESALPSIFHYFEKLLGRTWKRENITIKEIIPVSEISKPNTIIERILVKKTSDYFRASYTVKIYNIPKNPNNTYVKIQLANTSKEHPANQFLNANELFNQKCIFQTEIKVQAKELKPYKSYIELNPLDKEAEILNYLYKEFSYGIGHNCSVVWNKEDNSIKTTFLPQYDVKDTKNNFSKEDFQDNPSDFISLNQSLDIYNLSHFSNDNRTKIINTLNSFVNLYGKWIVEQKQKPSFNKDIENSIFKNLDYNHNRLKSNIELLKNDTIFRAFQLANTAMLIQIIISNDNDFSGKEKDLNELNSDIDYNNIDFFKNYKKREEKRLKDDPEYKALIPKYRPFQLAFLLLNIDSIIKLESDERNKIVDLIWFPTGGGKTEAYLSVAAFTIIYRRLMNETGYEGTSVIMRYTLRLLTAQQFERASRLIVSLEFLRKQFESELRKEPITIGMWVGMSSTPNSLKEAEEKVEEINEECNKKAGNLESKNAFQISSCSWCGTKLMTKNEHGNWVFGFKLLGKRRNTEFKIKCVNKKCHFHNELPIQVVDEMLYKKPPTLLFGTVDKFAMLAWKANGHRFFNSLNDKKSPPDLIIQDELHLLTGPLGTITGIFESVIEMLCTKNGRKPKIVSSTATTRNTSEQIKALYGNDKDINIFPPSGLSYDDSFFAKISKTESTRRYISFIPTGKSSINTQLQMIANLFVARLEVYKALILNGEKDYKIFDKYWTIVSYYNSLKDVGKIHNKVGDEISTFTSALQKKLFGDNPSYNFNYTKLYERDKELTGREESSKIKQTLKLLEENEFKDSTIGTSSIGNSYIKEKIIDLVLATNMISVGIDIDRFNIMLINGQPKNVAEYIQASSRVGRKYKGLVIDLLDANRARDKSHFEHFIPFHQAFYKSVEPVSLTPFTKNTLEKMLTSIMITFVRHKVTIRHMASNDSAQYFLPEMLDGLKLEIKKRFTDNPKVYQLFEEKLKELSDDWLDQIKNHELKNYEVTKTEIGLLVKPSEKSFDKDDLWSVMQSMREIDTNSFIKVGLPYKKNRTNG